MFMGKFVVFERGMLRIFRQFGSSLADLDPGIGPSIDRLEFGLSAAMHA